MTNWQKAAGAIVLLGGVAGALGFSDIRFWAWKGEAAEIGAVAYSGAISDKSDLLIRVEQQLRECQSKGENCSYLREQIERLKREIEDLKRKRARYSG